MNALATLSRALDTFWKILTVVVVTAFSLMLVVMAIQVMSRYALGIAVSWTDEVSRYLFIAEIFLGSVLALRYKEHIRITILTDILPASACRIVAIIADLISTAVLLMVALGAWNMMERTAGVFASTFQMSFSYIYLIQLVAALLMVLLLVDDLQRQIRGKAAIPTNDIRRE